MKRMRAMWEKGKRFLQDKAGASNVEIIIWISVVLVVATALFLMRDQISAFLGKATGEIGKLRVN